MSSYAILGLFLIIAILTTLGFLLAPVALRLVGLGSKAKPNGDKYTTYECGMVTVGRTHIQFNFRYYFYAVLFVTFDVIAVFLFPWALNLRNAAWFGLGAVAVLVAIIVVAYVYAWKKGVLQWK